MRSVTLIVVTTAACLALGCASAAQQPPAESDLVTSIENTEAAGLQDTMDERLATREGRMEMEPLDWDATRGDAPAAAFESPEEVMAPAGPPGASQGGAPDSGADDEAESLHGSEWEGLREMGPEAGLAAAEEEGVDFGTADVFTQYCEGCPWGVIPYPQRAVGKLFSNAGTCSASVVSGNDVIVTAAHCCYNRGTNSWIGGWRFAPAYQGGFAPYGLFDWSSATILTRWINVGDRRSDVCLIRLRNDAAGHGVTFYTGWLGRSWNFSTTQVHHALGYPGNIGGANSMELCVSESFNPNAGCGGTTVLNTGCSMTFGSSGGPWVREYRDGFKNYVNSVVSGYDGACTGSFGQTFNGPRFTSDNIVVLCNAAGC